jgi:hypothetical protein
MNTPVRPALCRLPVLFAGIALCLGVIGCESKPNSPTGNLLRPPEAEVALDTPVAVLHALQYGYEHPDNALLKRLFTDDFVFVFSQLDSAGNSFRDVPWNRIDELLYLDHLLEGGGPHPAADRITIDFTNTLVSFPSSRPGHDPGWHREVHAEVNVRAQMAESVFEIRGFSSFYFVRGDSAAIPADLAQQGLRPDSTRWWIDRWEDHTISASPALRVMSPSDIEPSQTRSWGTLRTLYR